MRKKLAIKSCLWKEYEYGCWDIGCGGTIDLPDIPKDDLNFKYCPYCAARLRQKKIMREC